MCNFAAVTLHRVKRMWNLRLILNNGITTIKSKSRKNIVYKIVIRAK